VFHINKDEEAEQPREMETRVRTSWIWWIWGRLDLQGQEDTGNTYPTLVVF